MELKLHIPDPILRSFFMGRFPRHGDGHLVDSRSVTGLVISSLVTHPATAIPDESSIAADEVIIYLPRSRYNVAHRNKYLVLSRSAEAKINAVLKQEFDMLLTSFCTDAKLCGFKVKTIIELFIDKYQLDLFDGDIDTLKKRYYRYELAALEKLREKLRQKAYYAVKRARKKMATPVIN